MKTTHVIFIIALALMLETIYFQFHRSSTVGRQRTCKEIADREFYTSDTQSGYAAFGAFLTELDCTDHPEHYKRYTH